MTIFRDNTAEGGTNGTAVSAGNSGGASGNALDSVNPTGSPALTFDSSVHLNGGMSMHCVCASTTDQMDVRWSTSVTGNVATIRVEVKFNAMPSNAATRLATIRTASTICAIMALNATNKYQVQDTTGTAAHTWANTLTTGQWYAFEMGVILNAVPSTSNGTILGRYFKDNSTTVEESDDYNSGAAKNCGTVAGLGSFRFMKLATGYTFDANFDRLAADLSSTSIGPGVTNVAPTADAGPDQNNIEPWSTVTLAGSGSDTDGTIAGYTWRQISGTAVTLSSTSVAAPTFAAPASMSGAVLVFGLVVTDDDGATSTEDTVTISVLSAPFAIAHGGVWVPLRSLTHW